MEEVESGDRKLVEMVAKWSECALWNRPPGFDHWSFLWLGFLICKMVVRVGAFLVVWS